MLKAIEVDYDPSNGAYYITIAEIRKGSTWELMPTCYPSLGHAMQTFASVVIGEYTLDFHEGHPCTLWTGDLKKDTLGVNLNCIRFQTLLLVR